MRRRVLRSQLATALACCLPARIASAHPGHYHPPEEIDEFDTAMAVAHPFTGIDHLVAAVAVGWVAWSLGRRWGGAAVAAYVAACFAGTAAGKLVAMPGGIDLALAGSLACFGAALATGRLRSGPLWVAVVSAFGLIQGASHAAASPPGAAGFAMAALLTLGTGAACSLGATAGWRLSSARLIDSPERVAGLVLSLAGVAGFLTR
jgi:urease accessory protein